MASELFLLDHRGKKPPLSYQRFLEIEDMIHGLGPDARCSGPLAAGLHPFDGYLPRKPYHFVLQRGTNRHRVGHYVHRTLYLPPIDVETAWGLPVTSPTRTLIDLAVTETPQALTAALDGALRDGLTTETFLHSRIVDLRGRGRYGIPKLLAVIEGLEASRGGHSWLERRYLELLAEHGLPRPDTQVALGRRDGHLIRVDCHFPRTRVVVELLGYRYHRTELQMNIDAARVNRLLLDGFAVLQFPYEMVVNHPAKVVADTIEALLGERAA
ncbi:MAG: DUF559 domain-containing protein [Actinomycetota bacterium]|nr:DUF559 domain-containing protein [Actinomycetota bacterium]